MTDDGMFWVFFRKDDTKYPRKTPPVMWFKMNLKSFNKL